jgi:succinate dehydrogenase hydrophobic anchor subunit
VNEPVIQRRWLSATLVALATVALIGDVVVTLGKVLGRPALPAQLAPAQVAVALAALALALGWVAQAWRNMRVLGSTEERSPAWAAFMWLTPGMNVVHIPRTMRTLWNESERPPLPRSRRVLLVAIWWACLCVGFAFGVAAFILRRMPSAPIALEPTLDIVRLAFGCVAAALFCALVLLIDARQRGPFSTALLRSR